MACLLAKNVGEIAAAGNDMLILYNFASVGSVFAHALTLSYKVSSHCASML